MFQLSEYITLLNDALKRNETIVFGCRCAIRYSGRAESVLNDGDRVVMIKADNALLVHQPTGNSPINYMKPGSGYTVKLEDNRFVLKATNILEKENMEISISHVYFFNSHKLNDGQTIVVAGTEEDMANMLYKRPEMIEKGFNPVSQEEQTKYGSAAFEKAISTEQRLGKAVLRIPFLGWIKIGFVEILQLIGVF